MPAIKTLIRLAEIFCVTVSELTGENVTSIEDKIFEYRYNRCLGMVEKLLGNFLPTVQSDAGITIISPERIEYKNGDVTFSGKQNAVRFKDAKDFVTAMELAESRALYEQISFNQAFRELIFRK